MADRPDLIALLLLAFVLGVRHGFDADHIAVVDGMTRLNIRGRPRVAPNTGLLFSIGHGAVFTIAALSAGWAGARVGVAGWLPSLGAWCSVAVLLYVGIGNLWAVRTGTKHLMSLSSRWLKSSNVGGIAPVGPGRIAGTGALFALSFDTLSQAGFLASQAVFSGGGMAIAAVSAAFVCGMSIVGSTSSHMTARMLQMSDGKRRGRPHVLQATLGIVSIAMALIGAGTQLSEQWSHWTTAHAFEMGVTLVVVIVSAFALSVIDLGRARSGTTTPAGPISEG